MTEQQHPITPPPVLVQEWLGEHFGTTVTGEVHSVELHIATQAARWGADQELEACCADIHTVHGKHRADWLREMRRPKPPSLKELAIRELVDVYSDEKIDAHAYNIIRRALEQLDD